MIKQIVLVAGVVQLSLCLLGCSSNTSKDSNEDPIVIEEKQINPIHTKEESLDAINGGQSSIESNIEEEVLNFEEIPVRASYFESSGGNLFYIVQDQSEAQLSILDINTRKKVKDIKLPKTNKSFFSNMTSIDGQNVWLLSVPLRNGGSAAVYQYNIKDEKLSSFPVNGHPGEIAVDNNSNVYLTFENGFEGKANQMQVYSKDGELKMDVPIAYYPYFFKTQDGNINVASLTDPDNHKPNIEKVNLDTGKIEHSSTLEQVFNDFNSYRIKDGVGKYTYLGLGNYSVIGYNSETNKIDELLDYTKYDIESINVSNVFALGEDKICIVILGEDDQPVTFRTINIG